MNLYGYFENDSKPKVSLGAVKFLTYQLDSFLNLYEKSVYIEEAEDRERLERLKIIRDYLKRHQYQMLINDPQAVIDFNDDNEDYLPGYYPL